MLNTRHACEPLRLWRCPLFVAEGNYPQSRGPIKFIMSQRSKSSGTTDNSRNAERRAAQQAVEGAREAFAGSGASGARGLVALVVRPRNGLDELKDREAELEKCDAELKDASHSSETSSRSQSTDGSDSPVVDAPRNIAHLADNASALGVRSSYLQANSSAGRVGYGDNNITLTVGAPEAAAAGSAAPISSTSTGAAPTIPIQLAKYAAAIARGERISYHMSPFHGHVTYTQHPNREFSGSPTIGVRDALIVACLHRLGANVCVTINNEAYEVVSDGDAIYIQRTTRRTHEASASCPSTATISSTQQDERMQRSSEPRPLPDNAPMCPDTVTRAGAHEGAPPAGADDAADRTSSDRDHGLNSGTAASSTPLTKRLLRQLERSQKREQPSAAPRESVTSAWCETDLRNRAVAAARSSCPSARVASCAAFSGSLHRALGAECAPPTGRTRTASTVLNGRAADRRKRSTHRCQRRRGRASARWPASASCAAFCHAIHAAMFSGTASARLSPASAAIYLFACGRRRTYRRRRRHVESKHPHSRAVCKQKPTDRD